MYALSLFNVIRASQKSPNSTRLLERAFPLIGCSLGCNSTSDSLDLSSFVQESFVRGYTSGGFDLTLPSRKHQFVDLPCVDSLLPNRRNLSPQFSPHGITLVPKSILQPPRAEEEDADGNSADASTVKKMLKLKRTSEQGKKRRNLARRKA